MYKVLCNTIPITFDSLLVAWAGQTQMGALSRAAGEIVRIWWHLLAVKSQMFEDANTQAHQCFSIVSLVASSTTY